MAIQKAVVTERYMYRLNKAGERNVRNYKIVLKATGAITQLPDSQKVFGALTTMYAETNGNEKAAKMVRAVLDKTIHLALSSVMPLHYFPMPQDYVVDKLAEKISEAVSLKEQRAAVKERAFISERDLRRVLDYPETCSDLYPYIKQSDGQQLRASMESVIYGVEGLETKLYTVPYLKLQEVKRNKDGRKLMDSVSEFCFYLQGDENKLIESVLDVIKELVQNGTSLILGKRASQGLNKYRVTDVQPIKLPNANYYLNLGMLLPDKIDYGSSTLKLFTSERRPFAMQGGWNQTCGKYFISFIDSGSVISLQNGVGEAGKCVPSPFNKMRDIVFGNAFLYPIVQRKEGKG